jgi:hypothetical protein
MVILLLQRHFFSMGQDKSRSQTPYTENHRQETLITLV